MQARRGYARGWEPVRFVDQVRGYLAVLEWYGDDHGVIAGGAASTGSASGGPEPPALSSLAARH